MIDNSALQTKMNGAAKLKELYTEQPSFFDIGVTMSSFFVWLGLIYKLIFESEVSVSLLGLVPILVTAFIASQVVADFTSGFVHWAGDTWGTIETPYIGKSLILFFREHHVDPVHMTHRSFFVTNSKPFAIIILFQVHLFFTPILSLRIYWYLWFWIFLTVNAGLSNQLHSYAHQPRCNKLIQFLQNWGIIISPRRHKVHHDNLDLGYCISNGWLNPVLDSIGFWRKLEYIISAITGLQPQTFVPLEL